MRVLKADLLINPALTVASDPSLFTIPIDQHVYNYVRSVTHSYGLYRRQHCLKGISIDHIKVTLVDQTYHGTLQFDRWHQVIVVACKLVVLCSGAD